MKRKLALLCVLVCMVASLACSFGNAAATEVVKAMETAMAETPQAVQTEEPAPAPTAEAVEVKPIEQPTQAPESKVETEFPLPDDANTVMDMGGGMINFQTGMKIDEVVAFYRQALGDAGYTEREITTVIDATVCSLVFDKSGSKSVVVQGVDLGNGSINVNIRYEE